MRIHFVYFLFIFSLVLSSHGLSQPVMIAAAADLRYAMDDLVREYNRSNPVDHVNVIYGSSGNLYQQIVNKASFHLFFSADLAYARKLDSLQLTESRPKLYAIGHLVLWSASLDLTRGVSILGSDQVKKIAIANPAVAPYGKRAVECLNYYKLHDRVVDKIVRGENVSQAAQFVLTGNAEAGLIALSLALSPEMMSKGKYLLLDEASYSTLEQAYVVLRNAATNPAVSRFLRFVETKRARDIFGKYGFRLPEEK